MKSYFKKSLLVTALGLASCVVMAGNPNGGGGSGVDQTARSAAATANANATNAQTTANNNATAITALQNPVAPVVGTDLTSSQGGIVACTFANGGFNLIASNTDDSTSVIWSNVNSLAIGAPAQSDTSGVSNTPAIIAQTGFTAGAAKVCRDKISGGFTDWYLPSKNELNCLYTNQVAIDGFAPTVYWSSSEFSASLAWIQGFNGGGQGGSDKDVVRRVRCVRAFNP